MRLDQAGIHILQRLEQLLAREVGVADGDEFVSVEHEDDGEEEQEECYEEGGVFDEGPDGWAFFVVFRVGVLFGGCHGCFERERESENSKYMVE